MCCENNNLNERLTKKLLDYEETIEGQENEMNMFLNSLEELSDFEDSFKTDNQFDLNKKTILDIGTDAIKPLYIALKLKPIKIIGINDGELPDFASDIEQKTTLLIPETRIRFYNCNLFNKKTLTRILKREKIEKFDFVLISKTLHHLRTKECIINDRNIKQNQDDKHQCHEDEKCCIYGFDAKEVFNRLFELGKRVIIYEAFCPQDEDEDKIRGRGGYFTTKEWMKTLRYLSDNYKVKFIRPEQFSLHKGTFSKIESILRKVDYVCFYIEK